MHGHLLLARLLWFWFLDVHINGVGHKLAIYIFSYSPRLILRLDDQVNLNLYEWFQVVVRILSGEHHKYVVILFVFLFEDKLVPGVEVYSDCVVCVEDRGAIVLLDQSFLHFAVLDLGVVTVPGVVHVGHSYLVGTHCLVHEPVVLL